MTASSNAGAVVKLDAVDINVGSPSNDKRLLRLQARAPCRSWTPQDNVYFTSYNDASLGGSSNSLVLDVEVRPTGAGLAFENDYDYLDANSATTRGMSWKRRGFSSIT